jgi:O-antigen ligase
VAVAAYFLLTHDWALQPAKFAVLNRIGLAIMAARPQLDSHILHPNVAGGLMAMTAPFLWASGWRALGKRDWPAVLLVLAGMALVGVALLLTTSRGAWLALLAGGGLWLLRGVAAAGGPRLGLSSRTLFAGLIVAAVGVLIFFFLTFPGGPISLLNRLPGPANVGSRADLARETLDLAADYPFTGGGLASFPGLFAQYVRLTPFFVIVHSHNFLLDVLLEQGLFALLAVTAIYGGSFWLLARPATRSLPPAARRGHRHGRGPAARSGGRSPLWQPRRAVAAGPAGFGSGHWAQAAGSSRRWRGDQRRGDSPGRGRGR